MLEFAILLLVLIVFPSILGRILHIHKLFPIFFIQLLLGVLIANVSIDTHQSIVEHLNFQFWSDSFGHLGWFGIACTIALSSSQASEYHQHQAERRFITISVLGFSLTFLINTLCALFIAQTNPELLGSSSHLTWFALSMGLSLSVTAVPILVAILSDLNVTPLVKNTAISAALLDDLWLWLGIGFVLSLSAKTGHPFNMLVLLALYLISMFFVVKPAIQWFINTRTLDSGHQLLLVITIILMSSVATELIGLHSIFGIFIAGLIMPSTLLTQVRPALTDVCNMLFVPLFFVISGTKIHLDAIGWHFVLLLVLFSVIATVSKFLSVSFIAKRLGFSWPDALTLGVLMQCKGLMELVVANVLLETGVISNFMFSILSIYALLSTLFTTPIIQLLNRYRHKKTLASPKPSVD